MNQFIALVGCNQKDRAPTLGLSKASGCKGRRLSSKKPEMQTESERAENAVVTVAN